MEFKVEPEFNIGDVIRHKSAKKMISIVKNIVLIHNCFSYHFEYLIEFKGNQQRWVNSIDIRLYELATED